MADGTTLTFDLPTGDRHASVTVARSVLSLIAHGGVSSVYRYEPATGLGLAIKLFNEPGRAPWSKALHTITRNAGQETNGQDKPYAFAWPISIAHSGGDRAGIVLPLFDDEAWLPLDHWIEFHLAQKLTGAAASLPSRLHILRNCAAALASLHADGMAVVDLKPSNILVHKTSYKVAFIDVDSFRMQSGDTLFPATHVSAGYILPTALSDDIDVAALDDAQDRYALAVIIFQVLNNGIHPFQGILGPGIEDANTNDDKAKRYLYAYGRAGTSAITPMPQSVHSAWPEALRDLLDTAFTRGRQAPEAQTWSSYFSDLLEGKQLSPCPDHRNDMRHIRFASNPCMYCLRDSKIREARQRQAQTQTPPQPPRSEPPPRVSRPPSPVKAKKSHWGAIVGIAVPVLVLGFAVLRATNQALPPNLLTMPSVRPSVPQAPVMTPAVVQGQIMPLGAVAWDVPPTTAQPDPKQNGMFTSGTAVQVGSNYTDPDGWVWFIVSGTATNGQSVRGYVRSDLIVGAGISAQPGGRCAVSYLTPWGVTPVYRFDVMDKMQDLNDKQDGLKLAVLVKDLPFFVARSIRAANGWEWHVVSLNGGIEGVIRADHLRPAPIKAKDGTTIICR